MSLKLISLLILGFTGLLSASGGPARSGLHREGEFWVDTATGSESEAGGAQLKVICRGNVTVRGGDGRGLRYTVTRRIRARSEAEASAYLQVAATNFSRQGHLMTLVIGDSFGPVETTVNVPRNLQKLLIGTSAGNVDASDLDGSVLAQTGAGKLRIAQIKGSVDLNTGGGGNLQLSQVGGSARAVSAGGDISADSIGGDVVFETAGGNVTVEKAGGEVHVGTAGGFVRIGQAGGAVVADTNAGRIDIGRAGGAVTIRNGGGGPIHVDSATSVRCESAGGAIKLGSVTGGVRASTVSGSVVAEFTAAKLMVDSLLSTGSGDITVILPSNLGVTIRARNDGSSRRQSIVSDFPELQVRNDGISVTAGGVLHGGGPVLRIEGAGGMISIKKK